MIISRRIASLLVGRNIHTTAKLSWNIPSSGDIDLELLESSNIQNIETNIKNRKSIGNIRVLNQLYEQLKPLSENDSKYHSTKEEFLKEYKLIPNRTHPDIVDYEQEPKVVKFVGQKKQFNYEPKEFHEISKRLNLVRTEQLGNVSGSKSYYLLGQMAQLEQALIRYFIGHLIAKGFQLLSVPDILPRSIVESCGMNTRSDRTQVYTLDPKLHQEDLCLSGTSELALAGYLANKLFNHTELPQKVCAVSRCYRAETSGSTDERGIFRVHEFTKVEMFIASTPAQSENILNEIRCIEEELFESLNIHFQVLDMPPHDLGAPAYRKFDIEAWMPGRKMYGEISSCSNCTDFQSRRLNIRYKTPDGSTAFVHTLNGTACAVPRLLITLTETHQEHNGVIVIPEVLRKYMNDKETIGRQKRVPELRLIKHRK